MCISEKYMKSTSAKSFAICIYSQTRYRNLIATWALAFLSHKSTNGDQQLRPVPSLFALLIVKKPDRVFQTEETGVA